MRSPVGLEPVNPAELNLTPDSWTAWQQVSSSNVGAVRYFASKKLLQVVFTDGAKYEYSGVDWNTWQNFLFSPSKGKFVHYVLKGFEFPYRRV